MIYITLPKMITRKNILLGNDHLSAVVGHFWWARRYLWAHIKVAWCSWRYWWRHPWPHSYVVCINRVINENLITVSMKTTTTVSNKTQTHYRWKPQSQHRWKPTVFCPNLCVLGLPALALWLLQDRIQTVRQQVERNMPGREWFLWLWITINAVKDDLFILLWCIAFIWSMLVSTCWMSSNVDLASADCALKSIPVTWPRAFDSVSVARIFFTLFVLIGCSLIFVFVFISTLIMPSHLKNAAVWFCIQHLGIWTTLGYLQVFFRLTLWEISHKQQIYLDIQPPEQVDAKEQAKNFQKHHALPQTFLKTKFLLHCV